LGFSSYFPNDFFATPLRFLPNDIFADAVPDVFVFAFAIYVVFYNKYMEYPIMKYIFKFTNKYTKKNPDFKALLKDFCNGTVINSEGIMVYFSF
jgi:hypothetical protein